MNEEQITTFLAILKRGSFSGAAQELYMSQPAVTHRIKTLEEELGAQLFVRDNARAMLTPAGSVFAKEAHALRLAFRHAYDSLLPFSQRSTLRIGFPSAMMLGECRSFFAVMNLFSQDDTTQLHSVLLENSEDNARRLLAGDVDLFFSDIDPTAYSTAQFGKRVLFHCTAYACVHREHRWAALPELPMQLLQEETIFRYRDSTHFSTQFNLLQRELQPLNMTDEFATITQALAQLTPQKGVVITNGKWVEAPSYVYIPLNPSISMRIGVIWLKKNTSPALKILIQRISELPQSLWRI